MHVTLNGKNGILEFDGTVVLPIEYDSINYLTNYSTDGILLIIEKDKKFALYSNRNFITDFKYDAITSFSNYIKVIQNNKIGLLSEKGELVYPIDYDAIELNKKARKVEFTKNGITESIDFKDLYKK